MTTPPHAGDAAAQGMRKRAEDSDRQEGASLSGSAMPDGWKLTTGSFGIPARRWAPPPAGARLHARPGGTPRRPAAPRARAAANSPAAAATPQLHATIVHHADVQLSAASCRCTRMQESRKYRQDLKDRQGRSAQARQVDSIFPCSALQHECAQDQLNSPLASSGTAAGCTQGLGRGFGAEGIMPGTLRQPMELRSEQLRAMGSEMLQGVLGPLQLYFTPQGC